MGSQVAGDFLALPDDIYPVTGSLDHQILMRMSHGQRFERDDIGQGKNRSFFSAAKYGTSAIGNQQATL